MKLKYLFTDLRFRFIHHIANLAAWLNRTFNINRHNPWRCKECGSLNVVQKVWADPNTGNVTDWISVEDDDCRCNDCKAHTVQIEEKELMRTVNGWWGERDFREMEHITGYRQTDFNPDEGYQAFVDACGGWWDGKTTEEKISIYFENQ